MKAAVIYEHGGAEKIQIAQLEAPRPQAGEVVVELRAAALNHLDVWVRRGGRAALKMPHVLGSDGAGVVAAVGTDVTAVQVGQEVVINPCLSCRACRFCRAGQHSLCEKFGIIGMASAGTFAEKIAVPWQNVWPKPAHLSFEEAAALTLAHLTAWRMVVTRLGLQPGETVLIHGIGGGAALAALQWAKHIGARAIVTSSSPEKLERARQLGADETIDYKKQDVAAAARQLTGGAGVDAVVDTVGAATIPIGLEAVRRGGRIVNCGVTGGPEATLNVQKLYLNQITLMGSTLGSDEDCRAMLAAAAIGRLRPVIDVVLPLEKAQEAAMRMEAAQQFGKIVLKI
jgi:NADPH:quinone reductase-like Zn-dependent oxidoreductase